MKLNFSSATLRSLGKSTSSQPQCRWYHHHLPNLFTFLRLLSVPVIFYLIITHLYLEAFCVFAFAGISDWADGYLARKWQVESTFGRLFDPIADKALMVICFVVLGIKEALPFWLVLLTVGRDLTIIMAGLYTFIRQLQIQFHPILVSKLNTFLQILLIGTTLIYYSTFALTVLWEDYFLLYRGIHYLYLGLIVGCATTTLWSWWRYGVYFYQELKSQIKGDQHS